ncbi:vacuolar protein sorting-associated protein 41 homolog [Ischnura elegans]|uniref:vacuolar protein sorting-associated protein 41 homolog n=1 Tax=Ischnura elegans TaxID=197161 RepID=UPI001ED88EFB|nr:vacuolar protein sorting-associated protein 41 homolog [Ischnura elegans]
MKESSAKPNEDEANNDTEDAYSSDGEDTASESSEDTEPKLKYTRLGNDVVKILAKDEANCIAVHPKFLCLGTRFGRIHILDHQGNEVVDKQLGSHSVMVNQISIDHNGDFIASCSDDGKVLIIGLYTTENTHNFSTGRLIKSIGIDPNYYKSGSGRRFITGDEKLTLYEKTGFLARLRPTVLGEAGGIGGLPITPGSFNGGLVGNLRWRGRFVAWSSYAGIRVYDLAARCSLGLIKWSRVPGALPEDYRCNLCWRDDHTLLVGWVDTVCVCVVRKRKEDELRASISPLSPAAMTSYAEVLPELAVEPVWTFRTDFFICGIGPLGENQLVLLGFPKEPGEDGKSQRPQVHVVEPKSAVWPTCQDGPNPGGEGHVKVSSDSLSMQQYSECKCNDYHLECLIEESRFFILNPKDLVVANPCDADDRVQWLIEHSRYEMAMEAVQGKNGKDMPKRYTPLKVGRAYLDHLLSENEFEKAGELCRKILGQDKALWEEEVYKFARICRLRAVSPYLPRGEESVGGHKDCQLDPHIYEMVLYEFLKLEPKGFLTLVKEWSPKLYNVPAVVNAVMEHVIVIDGVGGISGIVNEKNGTLSTDGTGQGAIKMLLLEALAILYSHEKKYDRALAMYLKMEHRDVFQLIKKHKLYSTIPDLVIGLMNLDSSETLNLLLDTEKIPPSTIVDRLNSHPDFLYLYLDALECKDTKGHSRKYHSQLMRFYAERDRSKLLPFLRRSDFYPIQQALDICEAKSYFPEMVYLLGRIGSTREALHLITSQLKDIKEAVNFCKQHNDMELWEDLITYSLDKPECITYLLHEIGTYIDPKILVQRIDTKMKIPGLKESLVKMMRAYNLQVTVQEGFKKILVSDYFNLHEKMVTTQQRGIEVDEEQVCGACNRRLISKDARHASNVMVFYCKHTFHEECFPLLDSQNCTICQSEKKPSTHPSSSPCRK